MLNKGDLFYVAYPTYLWLTTCEKDMFFWYPNICNSFPIIMLNHFLHLFY